MERKELSQRTIDLTQKVACILQMSYIIRDHFHKILEEYAEELVDRKEDIDDGFFEGFCDINSSLNSLLNTIIESEVAKSLENKPCPLS